MPPLTHVIETDFGLGAGAEGRRPLGVAVVFGMTSSTLLTLFVVPVVYSMVDTEAKTTIRAASVLNNAADSLCRPISLRTP